MDGELMSIGSETDEFIAFRATFNVFSGMFASSRPGSAGEPPGSGNCTGAHGATAHQRGGDVHHEHHQLAGGYQLQRADHHVRALASRKPTEKGDL